MIRAARANAHGAVETQAAIAAQQNEIGAIVARESAETLVGRPGGRRVAVMRQLIRPVAQAVARRMVAYDRMLGAAGPHAGAALVVADATGGLAIDGREHVPQRGPLLVVANHPGLSDAVSLLSALGREDAWIVAAEYPFLRALRLARRRFLFVPDGRAARVGAIRRIVSTLRDGESVIVFPAGGLEMDPTLSRAEALASLGTWSRSVELFARLAAGTVVLPALVRSAVSRAAFDHPLSRRRRTLTDRQRMASLLQLVLPAYRGGRVRVTFGAPIEPRASADVHAAVIDAMRALMEKA
jgi:1-acyl-sn-glycerol-3-phosphate acyltransferase